ncbi:MAG TPA: hypothetical protein VHU87_09145 [Rhizomicrobium sp.]|jgi:hypothetical protein|nr:hypothetical protein [Rhizomicrobium sp.]
MGILIGFAPFIVYALLASVSMSLALWLALAAAFVVAIRDFIQSKAVRLLDIGGMALFFLMALFIGFVEVTLKAPTVRLVIDLGFLLMAAISLIRRDPITLGYAREFAPKEMWTQGSFIRGNYIVTAVWTAAFAVTAAVDAVANFNNTFSQALEIAIGLAALGSAIAFTARYRALAPARKPAAFRW